jgi:hypothetical protein
MQAIIDDEITGLEPQIGDGTNSLFAIVMSGLSIGEVVYRLTFETKQDARRGISSLTSKTFKNISWEDDDTAVSKVDGNIIIFRIVEYVRK